MRERAYRTEKQMLNRIEELEGVSFRALIRVRGLEAKVERLNDNLSSLAHDMTAARKDIVTLTKRCKDLEVEIERVRGLLQDSYHAIAVLTKRGDDERAATLRN